MAATESVHKARIAVFDYRALRLTIGVIAFALPIVVSALAGMRLTSISASYYTAARDSFVGLLFVVGDFLWAYNGHSFNEGAASKIAGLCAALVPMFPTACDGCTSDYRSTVHAAASVILFSVLAYFCIGPFRRERSTSRKRRRSAVYLICGWVIVGCMLSVPLAKLVLSGATTDRIRLTYWGETIALAAFGTAWIVAGKWIPWLADDDERLRLPKAKAHSALIGRAQQSEI